MEELKTLKDMTIYIKDNKGRVDYDELKAEAIKWVKFLETTPVSYEDEQVIEFIKCFFNIELKGGKLQ